MGVLDRIHLQLFSEEATSVHDSTNNAVETDTTETALVETAEIAKEPVAKEPQSVVPESYDFSHLLGEGETIDEANAKAFSDVLHQLGVTQEGAESIAKFGMGYLQQMGDSLLEHIDSMQAAQAESWKQDTVKELGPQFDTTIAKAGAGIEYLEREIPNLRETLMVNGIGNHVALVKAFAMIGDLVAEDTGRLSGEATGASNNFYDNTNWDLYKQ